MEERPALNGEIAINDFKEFYWLKKELSTFCRSMGLPTSGSKEELTNRIEIYLNTGNLEGLVKIRKPKPVSKFDWSSEHLTRQTKITDNYKSTENVRRFYLKEIGPQFKFNVKFMHWMKSNVNLSLGESIQEWHNIQALAKSNKTPKEIAPQFEYNRYLRDFMADNPKEKRETGIKLWKIKRGLRGSNKYNSEDLRLLSDT